MRTLLTESFEPRTPNEREWLYNGLDCCVTLEVLQAMQPVDNVTANTYQFSRDLQGPILEMTMRGLRVDERRRARVLAKTKEDMHEVARQLDRILQDGIGISSSWRSTKDLRRVFYEVLGFKPIKKRNANGQFTVTVDREALEKLAVNFRAEPLCNRLLLLRDLEKKRQFLETPLDSDGRIRTNLNIGGTTTGRLASSFSDFGTGGNLQNVDRDLREIFIADRGMKFGNLDLEQGDSRNVGAICWERFVQSHGETFAGAYLEACESKDLHVAVAKMVWPDLAWDGVNDRKIADQLYYRNDSYRQISKKAGHATNFNGQPPEVSRKIRVEQQLIKNFQQRYFTAFPCVRQRIEWVKQELLHTSTITTLFGRRRIFFGRPNEGTTQREAYAYEPQSMTAHEINQGIINLFRSRHDRDWMHVWLHLQVHDSLLLQYPEEREDEVIPWAIQQLRVPLMLAKGREFAVPVDCKVGWNWGDFDEKKNPDGLKKWSPKSCDSRTRAGS